MVGTATTVGYALSTGFDRAARDGRPARRDRALRPRAPRDASTSACARCPNLAARSYRCELTNFRMRRRRRALPAPRGGPDRARRPPRLRDHRRARPVAGGRARSWSSAGLAREWDLQPGDRLRVERLRRPARRRHRALARQRRVPARRAARVYVGEQEVRDAFHFTPRDPAERRAAVAATIPRSADVTLTQARAVVVRPRRRCRSSPATGVRVLLSQAAGIVISLLVAFSLVALRRRRDDARGGRARRRPAPARRDRRPARARLHARGRIAARAGARGGAGGAARRGGARDRARRARSSPARRRRCWPRSTSSAAGLGAGRRRSRSASPAVVRVVVTAAATWPAWRAARRPPAAILRGGDLAGRAPARAAAAAGCSRPRRALRDSPRAGAGLAAVATIAVVRGRGDR